MQLFELSILTGVIFLGVGCCFLINNQHINRKLLGFPRSRSLSVFFMTAGTFWFLYRHVMNLSEADFGEYKFFIFFITLFIYFSSFIFTKDFLAVRGLSIIALLYSREVLDAAFLKEPTSRLFLVGIIYLVIVAALYFGAWPYRMRDFLNSVFNNSYAARILGASLSLIGIGLMCLPIFF